ncbi:MAG: copper amine oxidase N-terminal domain-containing protein [Syntrophomonadaceae bacterium]
MKKRFTCLFLILVLLTTLVMPAMASEAPTVILDEEVLTFDVPPMIQDGRVLVPMSAIFEAMGAQVSWDAAAGQAKGVKDGITVIIPINSTSPTINGVVKTLDVPAQIVNGRTLAPLSFIGMAFGGTVSWDAGTKTVIIKSPALPKTIEYKTYANNIIGYSLSYPNIFDASFETDNGDGVSMETADHLYNLKIWGAMNNVKKSTGQDLLAEAKNRVAHITSEYADQKFYRLSYEGGESGQGPEITFYECGIVSADKAVFFCISYPSSQQILFSGIVTHLTQELTKISLANG